MNINIYLKTQFFILILLMSGWAQADGQFYFFAEAGYAGSAAQGGQNIPAVYLRWNEVEGMLPDDVELLRLERNGTLLGEWTPDAFMSESDIVQMYQQPGQQQRLFQTLALLKEIALSEGNDFEPAQFAPELRLRLQDSYWRYLASRQNFNIARAGHRAYLDTDISPNTNYEYTLYAIKTSNTDQTMVGHATLNSGNSYQLLPVQGLTQLLPENCTSSQDHYSIALDWLAPGNNVTDQVSVSLQLAGYEIYRTTSNLAANIATPPVRDLAAEATGLNHDARGEMVFDGLERVNRGLLMIDGDGDPFNPEFFETPKSLQAAGLMPGDRRVYYVVGRDFSDHYGDTAAVIVQVPNRLAPVTPWNIVTGARQGDHAGINIAWDAVTLDNYKVKYPERVICNEGQAASSGLLEYAASSTGCATPSVSRIDVSGYRLYRFNNFALASNFQDSDGDGVADVADRDEIADGMQCDASRQPVGVANYSVALTAITEVAGSPLRLSFLDNAAGLVEGEFYYYRISSASADGKFSQPGIPLRELYPDVTPPAKPVLQVVRPTTESCCKVVALNANQAEWQFDDAIGKYDSLSLLNSQTQTSPLTITQFGLSSSELCTMDPGAINDFWGTAAGRSLIYPGQYIGSKDVINPPVYCTVEIPENMDLCKSGYWQLYESKCPVELPVADGDTVRGPVIVSIQATDDDSCLEYYVEIAGQLTRTQTSCGSDSPGLLDIETDAGSLCGGYAIARDSSNNRSDAAQLPCLMQAEPEPPSPPQVISLAALTDQLEYSWRSPLQPISATLIEISSDVGEADTQLISYPALNTEADGQPANLFSETRAVHTLLGTRDEWCVRAMAVGIAPHDGPALRSDWSGKLCQVRRENGLNETAYLPWPKVQPLNAGIPLTVELAADYVDGQQGEDVQNLPLLIHLTQTTNLFTVSGESPCLGYDEFDADNPQRHPLLARNFTCRDTGRSMIDRAVNVPFLMYRQAKSPAGETGPWVQVSPLIEYLYWERYYDKGHLSVVNNLDDPYFAMYRHEYSAQHEALPWHLAFVDRYPYIVDYEYRYQAVTFSPEHAIKSWRISDWVVARNPVVE